MSPALLPVQMVLVNERAKSWGSPWNVSVSGWVPRQRAWSWDWDRRLQMMPNILKSQSFSWRRSTQQSRMWRRHWAP